MRVASARRRDEQEAPRQKGYCLYSKLFNLFKRVGYFRRAVLASLIKCAFLLREQYDPKALFDEIKLNIDLIGGTLSGDDTVTDKPYTAQSLPPHIEQDDFGQKMLPLKHTRSRH
jgi:hypothetical protein